jgi:hypothetical protein
MWTKRKHTVLSLDSTHAMAHFGIGFEVDLPATLEHVCQPAIMLVPWRVSSR